MLTRVSLQTSALSFRIFSWTPIPATGRAASGHATLARSMMQSAHVAQDDARLVHEPIDLMKFLHSGDHFSMTVGLP